MNGKALETKAVAGSWQNKSESRNAAARDPRPLVLPVWEGWAGFGGNNCVCTEARRYQSEFFSTAGNLACSFEEDCFPVVMTFGREIEE